MVTAIAFMGFENKLLLIIRSGLNYFYSAYFPYLSNSSVNQTNDYQTAYTIPDLTNESVARTTFSKYISIRQNQFGLSNLSLYPLFANCKFQNTSSSYFPNLSHTVLTIAPRIFSIFRTSTAVSALKLRSTNFYKFTLNTEEKTS